MQGNSYAHNVQTGDAQETKWWVQMTEKRMLHNTDVTSINFVTPSFQNRRGPHLIRLIKCYLRTVDLVKLEIL